MSDIGRITSAGAWILATPAMTIPTAVKGIFIKASGSITITDQDGTSLTIDATADTVYPIRPFSVTAATTAYLLS